MPLVSVIVPNYNHAPFLRQRLETVIRQTFVDLEIILLDDASADNSREIITAYAARDSRIRLVFNEVNSGSTFRQWNKGVEAARGRYVWIAESDDYADETLLQTLVAKLEQFPRVGLAYCQSWKADAAGNVLGSWKEWTDALDPDKWRHDYVNQGLAEIRDALVYRNTIPNASAVLFRRELYARVGGADPEVAKCGDWYLWLRLLLEADVAFVAQPLNYFRSHAGSVIATAEAIAPQYDLVMRHRLKSLLRSHRQREPAREIDRINRQLIRKDTQELGLWQIRYKNPVTGLFNLVSASCTPRLDWKKLKLGLYYLKGRTRRA